MPGRQRAVLTEAVGRFVRLGALWLQLALQPCYQRWQMPEFGLWHELDSGFSLN